MHYVVTGATGFIGQHLCHRLVKMGHQVTGIYRDAEKFSRMRTDGIVGAQGDVTSLEFLRSTFGGADGCFHLAAIARPWARKKREFYDVNVSGTRHVLQAANDNKLSRVVFTSTASVFGPADAESPANETTKCISGSMLPYDESKRECEAVVQDFLTQGLDVVSVYPTRVFGPGVMSESNAMTRIIKQYLEGSWRWVPGDGSNVGNYVFVHDCVDGLVRAMNGGVSGEKYILGGENLTFLELTDGMNKISGRSTRFYKIPKIVLLMVATMQRVRAVFTGRRPMLTYATIGKFLKNWHVDNSKAQRELGFRSRPYLDSLAETMKWIQEESQTPALSLELEKST